MVEARNVVQCQVQSNVPLEFVLNHGILLLFIGKFIPLILQNWNFQASYISLMRVSHMKNVSFFRSIPLKTLGTEQIYEIPQYAIFFHCPHIVIRLLLTP